MLDRVIPLNERHLRQLLREYLRYHNEDRIHDALNKMRRMATSGGKAVAPGLHNLAASSRMSPPSLSLGRSCLKNAGGPCMRFSILATHRSDFRRAAVWLALIVDGDSSRT